MSSHPFTLRNKNILLISPQSWGKIHISKHHYAIELARRGNVVYFLNPPTRALSGKVVIERDNELENLYYVRYKPSFPYRIRYYWRTLFDFLVKQEIRYLLRVIGQKFDLVWCFESNLYSDLRCFNAALNIYHVADNVTSKHESQVAESAELVLTASEYISKSFDNCNKPVIFVNHGVSDVFLSHSKKILESGAVLPRAGKAKKVGYVGNLLIKAIDRRQLAKIINEHEEVIFYFWGPYQLADNNISGHNISNDSIKFVEFLKAGSNVVLKGACSPSQLADEIQDMDAFLICYDLNNDINNGSNCHKILEYLSTGKVVVSNFISTYENNQDIIQMTTYKDGDLTVVFTETMNNIETHNSRERAVKRIQMALDNSYDSKLEQIEREVNNILSDSRRK